MMSEEQNKFMFFMFPLKSGSVKVCGLMDRTVGQARAKTNAT